MLINIMGIRYNEDMSIITIPRILREKLGDEGADAFVKSLTNLKLPLARI
ncbi:LA_3696 family protein [Candidatus Magnetominusculus dajiuhuensis]